MIELNKYIDHTNLKATATESDIMRLVEEAEKYDFQSVCVNPCYVRLASGMLRSSKVKVCTVVGFPLGATTTKTKVFEALDAIDNGADEIDMVVNIAKVKEGLLSEVKKEIEEINQKIKETKNDVILKVIIETCYLDEDEIRKMSKVVLESGADYIKTSTGFGNEGAKVRDIQIMNEVIAGKIGIKAAGGIHDNKTAKDMIKMGATRIGTSSSIDIIN